MRRGFWGAEFPFSPKRIGIYYGWLILPGAVLGVIASIPGQTAGFSAFTEPLLSVSGLSRLGLSICYMLGTLASGLALPRAGRLLDQWGARKMACIATVGLAIVLCGMAKLDVLVGATLGRILEPTVSFPIALVAGIFGLRFFGQGMLPIISNTLIGRWFEENRGRAVSVMSVTNGVAFSMAPYLLFQLVSIWDWRYAWLLLAAVIGLLGTTFFWFVYRDSPESCGMRLDQGTDSADDDAPQEMTGDSVEEALKTRAFWACAMMPSAFGLFMTAVTFHIVALGTELGVSTEKALTVFVPISAISIPVGFASSWLSGRIGVPRLLQAMALGQVVGYGALTYLQHPVGYVLTAIGLGLAGGMFGPVQTIGLPAYFGRLHLGAINGKFYSLMVVASALGPAIFAGGAKLFGGFEASIWACIAIPLTGFFMAWGLPRPLRDGSPSEGS